MSTPRLHAVVVLIATFSLGLFAACFKTEKADATAKPAPAAPPPGQRFAIPGLGLEMLPVPAGTFTMGSPSDEPSRDDDERQHEVKITRPYWLGRTEVTQKQWLELMGTGPVEQARKELADNTAFWLIAGVSEDADPVKAGMVHEVGDNLPMIWVSWREAMAYCGKLTERERAAGRLPEGYEYTLPTEAQWEYACRAGTTAATYAGPMEVKGVVNTPVLDEIAWYGGNSSVGYTGRGVDTASWLGKQYPGGIASYREVGLKKPNTWGFCDMLGNVYEWCADWYGHYPSGKVSDYAGPVSGSYVVTRGGGWLSNGPNSRSANRSWDGMGSRYKELGFRLALTPQVRP